MFCCPYCGGNLERIRADKIDDVMINQCQNIECGQFVKISACKLIKEFDGETMSNFKEGDFVYFSLSNEGSVKLFTKSGAIISISDEKISILYSGSGSAFIYNVTHDYIRPLSDKEDIIQELNAYYDAEVEKYQSKIKSVKREYYNDEIVSKYNLLKQEILNTARNMIINTNDEESFENKLKAICQKKKELFAIECEGMNDARKYNGEMKYNIKKANRERDCAIEYLDKSIDELKRKMSL